MLGVGLPAAVDQRESAPKPRAVWGQLLAPRERRSRAHGHDADTAAGAVLVDWADNVTAFTAERGASTDAGLGDRRGEIRAAAPLGCSHEAGRSAVHGGGRPPRHEIRRIGASAWLSCCPREPAGAGAARSRHGLVAIRPPWSNSDVHVVANFCREHEANLSAGDPCLCGAPGRQARTGETPSQPWRPPPLLAVPVVWRSTALQYPVGIPNCPFLLIGPLGTQISAPVKVSPSELSDAERDTAYPQPADVGSRSASDNSERLFCRRSN